MPGKVNPVIPEVVTQVAAQVIGNDAAITIGGMQGHFELNVFIPLMARNLLESIRLLAAASRLLAEKCVAGIEANREQCERYAELTLSAATALNPYIGYDKASEIVKEASRRAGRCARLRARRASRTPCSTRRSTTARWRSRTDGKPLGDPELRRDIERADRDAEAVGFPFAFGFEARALRVITAFSVPIPITSQVTNPPFGGMPTVASRP